jgi:transposase
VHPKTVRRALQRGGPPRRRGGRRGSLLDPYRSVVDRLLSEGVWNAVVIWRELQAKGYPGSLSVLRDHIQPKRALRPSRATVRFETEPGRQLQTDWATQRTVIAGQEVDVHLVVSTLSYSRRFHVWGTDTEDAEHTYEGLVRAFEWFGGAPAEVLVDNQKCAVLAHRRGQAVEFHPRFLDLAGHYGFVPRACRPARAQTKGKDERNVGYVKHHFFVRYRAFDSWAHLSVEFPGFGGHPVTAVSEPLRTALGSRRLGDCGGGPDCRSYRCSRRHRSGRAPGSCRSAS